MSKKSDDDIIAEKLLDENKIAEKKQSDENRQEIIEVHSVVEYQGSDVSDTVPKEEIEYDAQNGMKNYLQFKEEYALIVFGNDVKFVHKFIDDKGDESFVVKKKNAARDEWADRKAYVQIESLGGEISYLPTDVTVLAIEGVPYPGATEHAREYGKPMKRWQGISFDPGKETKVSYNRYRGFPVEPEKGDIALLLKFLEEAFGKEGMEIVLIFFASMYQHPEIKLRWMLSIIGEKGLGKNTVEELLGKNLLYSENYVRAGNKDHLFNKFNAIFETNLLTVAQEIIWDGDQKLDSILKEWVTESTRTIERKFVDPYTVGNCSRIFMTSNADWVVPASGREERRYAVLRIKDTGYSPNDWNKLYEWAEENKGAIMEYLMSYPLKENYYSRAPYTVELRNQLRQGLSGVEAYIFDGISNGYFGKPSKYDKDVGEIYAATLGIEAKRMFKSYMETRDTKEKLTVAEFGKKLAGAFGSGRRFLSFESKRVGKRKATTYFPGKRKECAKVFCQATGVEIYFDEDDSEWHKHE